MMRAFHRSLVGACLLLGVAGCARTWFAEREPWRREAEISCLRSGAVKEGPSVTISKTIDGPGACGVDYPLHVAALGEDALVSFADEPAYAAASSYAPGQNYPLPPTTVTGMPLSLASPSPNVPYAQQRAPLRTPVEPVPVGRAASAAATARPAAISPAATLACPLVSMLDRFVSESVQPAATRWFGQPVVEIKQISAYSCRGMNGDSNARISEHAFGNALDIAAFILADGRTVSVKDGWHGAPEEQAFLHDVQSAACQRFTTVLAPGSNAYHYDHMHVDLMRRSSGHVICEPTAIPGEAAFARASGRYGETSYAGSLAVRRYPRPAAGLADPAAVSDRKLPSAVAGAD